MAVHKVKKNNSTHIRFSYRDGYKVRNVYCGKKGLAKTDKNVKKAKWQWYKIRLEKMQKVMNS